MLAHRYWPVLPCSLLVVARFLREQTQDLRAANSLTCTYVLIGNHRLVGRPVGVGDFRAKVAPLCPRDEPTFLRRAKLPHSPEMTFATFRDGTRNPPPAQAGGFVMSEGGALRSA